MVDATAELRATSDLLLLELETLQQLEEQKRLTPHGDAKLVDLAARIEEIAQRLLNGSRRQRELTEAVTEAAQVGEVEHSGTIEAMRSVAAILADWREAERVASQAAPGTTERSEAESMAERFRDEYRRAFENARAEAS
ncbi:MAG TPA: hypothetical protein VFP56_01970 [Candidatus Limnocylindrales bacterium]|nr:hypothetical protein [Candidatus Limnocylindrales bacterium]